MNMKQCKCGRIIPIAARQCSSCMAKKPVEAAARQKRYDTNQRDPERTAFYNSKEWKLLRQAALNRDCGQCVKCAANDVMTPMNSRLYVDHIVAIKDDWSLRFSLNNLQTLCPSHHAMKTKKETEERNRKERMKINE